MKEKRFCFKCKKEIKDNSAIGWFILRNKLYCRKCALKVYKILTRSII